VEIRVLGHLEASVGDRPLALGGSKQRAVLAMLALDANHAVTADRISEGLWGEVQPPSAGKMVQNYVWRLRRTLTGEGGAEILTRGRAYELQIDADLVDACRLERLVAEAGRAAAAGDPGTRLGRHWRCSAAPHSPTWPTSRSRRTRSAGSRSCG
jgi:DNA-binding SARP family transcriptional activator